MTRPCRDCNTLTTDQTGRCKRCRTLHNQQRNQRRTHYHGTHQQQAAHIRATATHCWICGQGPRPHDPWQADHLHPGNPNSPLAPAHRTCNAKRGNTPYEHTQTQGHPPNTQK